MANGLHIAAGVFSIGANGFSTANRYLRQVSLVADRVFTMVEGSSIAVTTGVASGETLASWRYECGALTISGGVANYGPTPPSPGFAIDRDVGL